MSLPKDWLYSIVCAALVAAAILATIPVLEMGTNDDWSYTWVAREFAATGHLTYNGWIAAMIGVQAAWAALFIRLFGFSFTLVRLTTLPFAAGCAVLLYRMGRDAGLNPSFAMFGSLSVTLSPLSIPLAASFMTDVPGLFFWLACIYFSERAARTPSVARACVWMAGAAIAGVAGGTVRQVVWIVPLLTLPAVAWLRRRERTAIIGAILLWCASAVVIALCVRWYFAQPYVTQIPHISQPWFDQLQDAIESILQIVMGCLLLIMPALALHVSCWRKWLRARWPLAIGVLCAGALVAAVIGSFEDDLLLGNIITKWGIISQGTDLLGLKPEILITPVRFLLSAALIATAGITAATLWVSLRSTCTQADDRLRRFILLFGPTSAVYFLILVFHAVRDWSLFDRYLIPFLPALVILLLWNFERACRETPQALGWAVLALFACFGIAMTHDYLASCRARLQAAETVRAAGIPRNHISAGLEYDGWTQVEMAGHLPSAVEQAAALPRNYPVSPPYWYWDLTPIIEPIYIVTHSRLPTLADSQFPPTPYTAWLPPFHRQVFTQKAK